MQKITRKDSLAFETTIKGCKTLEDTQKKFLLNLSDEQRQIVLSNAKYSLVRSAAGSGKTTVLAAKYLYLTRVLGVHENKIVYLSYNNRNVNDTAKKLKDLSVSEDKISTFALTFHALALRIISSVENVWPELLEQVQISWDTMETDHDRAEVYLSTYRDELKKEIESDSRFRKAIIRATVRSKGNKPHRYVSYYLDRNGIPGSCRSKQEKEIFEKLAKCGVDFAYEEADKDNHRRPDFTIYSSDGKKIIYEHFTAKNRCELETIGQEDGERYLKDEREKIEQYPKIYGQDNCIFTFGAKKSINEIWTELKQEFDSKNIAYDESKEWKHMLTSDKILEIVVDKFKEVRNQIVETGKDVMSTAITLSRKRGYVGYFFRKVFIPIENKYSRFIADNSGYTDFADSIVKATGYCKKYKEKLKDHFSYDYVLVDEFQDISISRHELLKALKSVNHGLHLLAVGDDWQSIYSFSCSDLSLFYKFEDNWGKQSTTVDMSKTFRFGGSILEASTSFIKKNSSLSPHEVNQANGNQTELIIKPFEHSNSFEKRRTLQWNYIKKEMEKELRANPNTEFLVLSRYSNVAKWFQKELQKSKLTSDKEISLTIHRAKGLTADVVFIQECHNNAIPLIKDEKNLSEHDKLLALVRGESFGKAGYENKLKEERRLFYVALTRAKKKVYVLYDADMKSKFVDEIWEYRNR